MRNPQRTREHTPNPPAATRRPPTRRAWADHPRLELISDGVVAGYIHDISIRHGSGVADPKLRRRRGDR